MKTASGWQLNIPPKYSASGNRERHYYRTRALAQAAADKLKEDAAEHGTKAQAIPPALAESAVACMRLLAPFDLTLLEAVRIAVGIKTKEHASVLVSESLDSWLAACGDLRAKTKSNYGGTCARLRTEFGDRVVASLAANELQAVLCPPGATGASILDRHRHGRAWWGFCAKQGWCSLEVFKAIEAPRGATDGGEISVVTPEDARALLEVTAANYPQAVAHFALALFAGIRSEEITRLDESDVSADGIELHALVTKKGRRRHIEPNATLRAWLERYPFTQVARWSDVSAACRRLAGWQLSARLLAGRELEPATRGAWPQNCLRHSFASYAIASGVSLESLMFSFGHSGTTPSLLREHYLGRVNKRDALEYFQILPAGADALPIMAAV